MKSLIIVVVLATFMALSCSKKNSCENCSPKVIIDSSTIVNQDTILTDSTIFFDVTIGGKRYFKVSGKNGWGLSWAGDSESDITGSANGYGFYLLKYNMAYPTDTSVTAKNNWVLNAFALGNYPYTTAASHSTGVTLKWVDANGKTWTSDKGLAIQQNSTFTILQRTLITIINSQRIHPIIYCIFNCTLYDDQGNELQLTAGRLRYGFFLIFH